MEKTDDTCPSGAYHRRLDTTPPAVIDGLLKKAGVRINGDAPWDIQVHDPDLYRRVLTHGSLGFGEAYMDGLWDAERLDELLYRLMRENIEDQLTGVAKLRILLEILRVRLFNLQSSKRAFQVGKQHYDTGNDVFEAMLDPTLSYTCGFWQNASTLHEAQLNKLKLICDKLELKPGERLLDIGCGWGGLVKYAAENYGVEAVGITVSREQQQLAQQRMGDLPVSIELIDYRDVTGQFDKLVSVGMFEHVGPKNYSAYFDTAKRIMKEDGLFLLHTIGTYKTAPRTDPWIDKYIFPNGKLPSMKELSIVLEDRFIVEDWHNFGQDYDKTLMTWWDNFNAHWPQLKDKYGERFYRMWKYYLLCCAGFFRSRQGQLWQLVLSNRHRAGQYRSIR